MTPDSDASPAGATSDREAAAGVVRPPADRRDEAVPDRPSGPPSDWMEAPPLPEPRRRRARGWPTALALAAVLAGVALIVTFAFLQQRDAADVPDLLALAAERADLARVAIGTGEAEAAHQFILDQFGWPLDVPRLASAALVGVGVDPLVAGVELPFLRYRTPDGAGLTVYAFDYAFLDAASRQVGLAPAVYAHLAEPDALDVRRQGRRYVVVWRRRAAIYAAVTDDSDAAGALTDEVGRDEAPPEPPAQDG